MQRRTSLFWNHIWYFITENDSELAFLLTRQNAKHRETKRMWKKRAFSATFSPTNEIQIESAVIIMPACVLKCEFFYITDVFCLHSFVFLHSLALYKEKIDLKSNTHHANIQRKKKPSVYWGQIFSCLISSAMVSMPWNKQRCRKKRITKKLEKNCESKCRCNRMRFMRIMCFPDFIASCHLQSNENIHITWMLPSPSQWYRRLYAVCIFCRGNLRNFLFIFQYNLFFSPDASWNSSNGWHIELHEYSANQMNILLKRYASVNIIFMKSAYENCILNTDRKLQAEWTPTSEKRVHFNILGIFALR